MGCDIHSFAERKHETQGLIFWHCCDRFKLDYFKSFKRANGEDEDYIPEYTIHPIYDTRNYKVFEALAGVRGKEENALFEVKGDIPTDASSYVREMWERWGIDCHTPSYITIRELFNTNSVVEVAFKGYLTPVEAADVDVENYEFVVDGRDYVKGCYTEYREWTRVMDVLGPFKDAYYEAFKIEHFLDRCSDDYVLNTIDSSTGDNYRIVFWFDN